MLVARNIQRIQTSQLQVQEFMFVLPGLLARSKPLAVSWRWRRISDLSDEVCG
jgi:hypothetical protein